MWFDCLESSLHVSKEAAGKLHFFIRDCNQILSDFNFFFFAHFQTQDKIMCPLCAKKGRVIGFNARNRLVRHLNTGTHKGAWVSSTPEEEKENEAFRVSTPSGEEFTVRTRFQVFA